MDLFSFLPYVNLLIDLFSETAYTPTAGGMIYDLIQALSALHILAILLHKLSLKTPWTWDDGSTKGAVGFLTTALDLLGQLSTANTREMAIPVVIKLDKKKRKK